MKTTGNTILITGGARESARRSRTGCTTRATL